MVMLNTHEISPDGGPVASVIWLHGLGADGYDFAPIADELALPFPVRYVFPHAPSMPVTVNAGYVMPAWYDIVSMDIAGNQDETGIRRSQGQLIRLIEREVARGVPAEKILLAGFSQGGAIALQTALRSDAKLAGVMALSTYLPLVESFHLEVKAINRKTPVFMAHGRFDTVIPIRVAQASLLTLQQAGYDVEWQEYVMEHSVIPEEIGDIRRFLMRVLS